MDNIKKWCSNKENIKILFMIIMAIVLVVVLKNRFSGTDAENADSSAVSYETGMESHSQDSVRDYIKRIPIRKTARSKKVKFHGLKPPPSLKRDLFFSRNPGIRSIRKAEQVEQVEELTMQLTATIIDSDGALAIIGNEVLGMGDMVKGLRVTVIKKNEVVLSKGKKQYVLRIKEE